MDNIIKELKELFQLDCHLAICEEKLKIKETGLDAKLKEVIIKNLDEENSFCVKLDVDDQKFSPYFNPHYSNIGKGVDAVLFTKKENDYFLFFIEMKSTTFTKNEVINKFKSSSAFIQYINNLLIQFSEFKLTAFNVGFMVCYLKNQKSAMRTKQSLHFELKGKDKYENITILEIYKSSAKHFEFSIDKLIENHHPFPFSLYK